MLLVQQQQLLRGYVRAWLPAWSTPCISWFFNSSAQTQQPWRIEFFVQKYRSVLEILLALPSRTSSGHRVPGREDFQNTSIFLYENSILYAWTKCTFGSVFSLVSVLIARFRHGKGCGMHAGRQHSNSKHEALALASIHTSFGTM